jgi:hypothetical protein
MKTSLALLILLGFSYLYVLESVGNFISGNLELFKRSLQEQDLEENRGLKILRTPVDLTLEEQNLTQSEL